MRRHRVLAGLGRGDQHRLPEHRRGRAGIARPEHGDVAIASGRAAFDWHTSYGSGTPPFWRILNTWDADNLPPSRRRGDRWDAGRRLRAAVPQRPRLGRLAPIVEALEDCEASSGTTGTDVPSPPPTPEVSISAATGYNVSTSNAAQRSPLDRQGHLGARLWE